MILKRSYIDSEIAKSPLNTQSVLRPKTGRSSRPLMFTLALTSLIDAFSILVIFLLIQGPSGQKELNVKNVSLPSAELFSAMDDGVSIRIERGHYFINETEVALNELTQKLYEIKQAGSKSKALIVQADKRSEFQSLNPIIQAGAQTGFEQIKFAVLPRKGS